MYRRTAVCSSVGGKEGGEMIGGYKKGFSKQGVFKLCAAAMGSRSSVTYEVGSG